MATKNLVKQIVQSDVYTFSKYPYSTGQKFYATDSGIFYEDIGKFRCAIVPSKLIFSSSTISLVKDTNLANNFAILNNAGTYSIYYYDKNGFPNLISDGGDGNVPYHMHDIVDVINALPQETAEWRILNGAGDFKIQQNEGSESVPNWTDRIIVYQTYDPITESPVSVDYKVKIDGKLDAELDCGGW